MEAPGKGIPVFTSVTLPDNETLTFCLINGGKLSVVWALISLLKSKETIVNHKPAQLLIVYFETMLQIYTCSE